MHEKVKLLLEQKKAEQDKMKKEEKEEFLLSLGLFDDSKPVKYFFANREIDRKEYELDKEKGYPVTKTGSPIEVSDEEFEEILKFFPKAEDNKPTNTEILLEKIERHTKVVSTAVIVYIILSIIVGIIIAL